MSESLKKIAIVMRSYNDIDVIRQGDPGYVVQTALAGV
jgi:hypothetical protein